MKTEQTTILFAQGDKWASYDVIKHHMITTDVVAKGNEESTLLRTGLSHAVDYLRLTRQ